MRRIVIAAALCLGLAACSPSTNSPTVTSSNFAPQSSQQLTTSTAPTATPAPASLPDTEVSCNWGIGILQGGGDTVTSAIYSVRVGRHACYERVVFDLNGAAQEVAYDVEYGPVSTEGKGDTLTIPGATSLRVVMQAPALGYDSQGHQPGKLLAQVGDYVVQPSAVQGWQSLRGVRFGGTFENQSVFLIGVAAQRGVHVSVIVDQNQVTHMIVDVAVS